MICGFGRLGEWFGVERYGVVPDLVTIAKGLTSAYAPMGAVLVVRAGRRAAVRGRAARCCTASRSPGTRCAAAIALRNIEIFEREGMLEQRPRARAATCARGCDELRELPIVGDVRGAGFFWAIELVKDDDDTRFDAGERERAAARLPARAAAARPG